MEKGVNYQCQCSLFKQFTTGGKLPRKLGGVSTINVNVLFLSNSQRGRLSPAAASQVSTINVNVLFLSNSQPWLSLSARLPGVNYQCQCSLFKQFTTILL